MNKPIFKSSNARGCPGGGGDVCFVGNEFLICDDYVTIDN